MTINKKVLGLLICKTFFSSNATKPILDLVRLKWGTFLICLDFLSSWWVKQAQISMYRKHTGNISKGTCGLMGNFTACEGFFRTKRVEHGVIRSDCLLWLSAMATQATLDYLCSSVAMSGLWPVEEDLGNWNEFIPPVWWALIHIPQRLDHMLPQWTLFWENGQKWCFQNVFCGWNIWHAENHKRTTGISFHLDGQVPRDDPSAKWTCLQVMLRHSLGDTLSSIIFDYLRFTLHSSVI